MKTVSNLSKTALLMVLCILSQTIHAKVALIINKIGDGNASIVGNGSYDTNSIVSVLTIQDSNSIFLGYYENDEFLSSESNMYIHLSKNRNLSVKVMKKNINKPYRELVCFPKDGGILYISQSNSTDNNIEITAHENANYKFEGIFENGVKISSNYSYDIKDSLNRIFLAKFKLVNSQKLYSNAYSFNNDRAYSSRLTDIVNKKPGDQCYLSFELKEGYGVDGIYDNNVFKTNLNSYVFIQDTLQHHIFIKLVQIGPIRCSISCRSGALDGECLDLNVLGDGNYYSGTICTLKLEKSNCEIIEFYDSENFVTLLQGSEYIFRIEKDMNLIAFTRQRKQSSIQYLEDLHDIILFDKISKRLILKDNFCNLYSIEIIDHLGHILKAGTLNGEIDLTSLNVGIYFAKIFDKQGISKITKFYVE